jgi:hypothetical protein
VTATRLPPAVRSWPRAFLLAAVPVWLPTLTPFGVWMLREGDHGAAEYAKCLPIVPGVVVPVLMELPGGWFFVVGGLVTVALASVLAVALRELPRPWSLGAQAAVALAVSAEAVGFASLLQE